MAEDTDAHNQGINDLTRKRVERPPLGRIRDLNQEEADRRLRAHYIEITKYPELANSLSIISTELNFRRSQLGLPAEYFNSTTVRLIESDVYDSNRDFEEGDSAGAFFDPYTRVCFIRIDTARYQHSEIYRKWIQYAMAHEMSHKATEGTKIPTRFGQSIIQTGIDGYSYCLNEGMTDLEAKDILETRVLPIIFTDQDYSNRRDYFDNMSPIIIKGDITADFEDLYYVNPDEGGNFYSRPLEIHILNRLKELNPKIYGQLRVCVYKGQSAKAREIVTQLLGQEMADLLEDSQEKPVDKKSVLEKLPKG